MYKEIAANKRKTVYMLLFFLVLVFALDALLSWRLGGSRTVLIGVMVGSVIYAAISYFSGLRMAMAVNGAQEIGKKDNPRLWNIIENLAITDGLPMPRVFIMDDPAPNAFATGRDPKHAAVCATTGILQIMDDEELRGVFAHEMAHVKNYDIRVSLIAFALSAALALIADILLRATWFSDRDREDRNNQVFMILAIVAAILAPFVAMLIQLAVSRRREYLADATGALTTRYPEGLARALEKIAQTGSTVRKQNSATAHLFFANPLSANSLAGLFSTHPPIEERIMRLRSMLG